MLPKRDCGFQKTTTHANMVKEAAALPKILMTWIIMIKLETYSPIYNLVSSFQTSSTVALP